MVCPQGMVGQGTVAVKRLTETLEIVHENKFHKEVECLMKAKHENIVRFLGYCAEARGKAASYEGNFVIADTRNRLLCFEYLPNGSLEKYITNASIGLEWKERFRIIKGICKGLHYLHMNRILHLDLKPANILLDGHMIPKIADFGLSRCLGEEKTHGTTKHLSGTPGYLAPEFYNGKFTFASDIYSLGVVIMEILTGAKGYSEDENVAASWMNRLDGKMQLEQLKVCTKIGIECMESDPKRRPFAWCIVNMIDKTASADETNMTSSLDERQVCLLNEQSDQERIGKLADTISHEDIKERPEIEVAAGSLGSDHSQEGQENTDHWSSCDLSTERKDNIQGTSISNSNSIVLDKLSILKIFNWGGHRNFVRNGGRQLKNSRGLRIFTKGEIKKITMNNSVVHGEGTFSRTYKGILPDFTMVAVSTIMAGHYFLADDFVKSVEIQTQLIHKNILKLLGYCLEKDAPILVHEFAAKGSLKDILCDYENQILPLDLRLDIAIGSAEGLRYIHSTGIRHGNVKPDTILLDEMFTPKISDFELSELVNTDGYICTTAVGTILYMDPMIMKDGIVKLTQKNDVYSFGVVLLELITRMEIDTHKFCEIESGRRAMFDKDIAVEEDIPVLEEIGKLAFECLKGEVQRPDMTEVTKRLMMLKRDRILRKARKTN
uniref:Protein kinase domain-containing protein n=1 Tax=Aegilops tauschii subsp. strangulata TaxID=200361 RepID=A0A452XMV0_AEGTS